jgi:DNA-binding LytR/AlgR family response regulator
VDGAVFIYTKDAVYETALRIYQIEEKFKRSSFVRVSKSAVVNLRKMRCIRTGEYGRMTAELANGEQIVISRQYVPDIKERLGI